MMRKLLYVTKVDLDEISGQATFERGMLKAFNRLAHREMDFEIIPIVARPGSGNYIFKLDRLKPIFLPKKIKKPFWYLVSEFALALTLLKLLIYRRSESYAIFVRYNSSMVCVPIIAALFNVPLVVRSGPVFESLGRFRGALTLYEKVVIKTGVYLFCKVAKRIIVVTKGIADWFIEYRPQVRDKLTVIPNAADPDELPLGAPNFADWGLAPNKLTLGFVGSFVPEQGVQTVIRALSLIAPSILASFQVLLVGDGPAKRDWVDLGQKLGISENLIWAGSCPRTKVPSALASCDMLLLPVTGEVMRGRGTSAIKLYEYLAADKLILASRGEDFLFLEEERVGMLIEPDNADAWARAIEGVVSSASVSLNGRGRKLVLDRFNYDKVVEMLLPLLFEKKFSVEQDMERLAS